MLQKIGDIPITEGLVTVYKRKNGDLYLRMSKDMHIKCEQVPGEKNWLVNASPEWLNPNEEVELIFPLEEDLNQA